MENETLKKQAWADAKAVIEAHEGKPENERVFNPSINGWIVCWEEFNGELIIEFRNLSGSMVLSITEAMPADDEVWGRVHHIFESHRYQLARQKIRDERLGGLPPKSV